MRVPATTANLGPGFDCLGLALDLWNDMRFCLEGDGVRVATVGEHSETLPTDETNLVARSFLRLYEEAGAAPPAGLAIHCDLRVPPSSGLGSSAAAVVAGLLGANTLLGGRSTRRACWSWPPRSTATPTTSPRPCSAASPSWCAKKTRC